MARLALALRPAPDAGAAALDALARVLAPRVAELLGAQREGAGLVDVCATVPGPKRRVMRACRTGGRARRWLASRSSIEAWLRSCGPRAVPAPTDDGGDGLEALRARLARPERPRTKRRAG